MNFFEAQDNARRTTGLLVILFGLAIVLILLLSNFIIFEAMYFSEYGALSFSLSELKSVFDADLCILICTAIVGFICLGCSLRSS